MWHGSLRGTRNYRFAMPLSLHDVSKGARIRFWNLCACSQKRHSIHPRIVLHSNISVVSICTPLVLFYLQFRVALGQSGGISRDRVPCRSHIGLFHPTVTAAHTCLIPSVLVRNC